MLTYLLVHALWHFRAQKRADVALENSGPDVNVSSHVHRADNENAERKDVYGTDRQSYMYVF